MAMPLLHVMNEVFPKFLVSPSFAGDRKPLGASASLKELQRKFSFEPKHVAAATKEQLGEK
jgi:hypothetical protein